MTEKKHTPGPWRVDLSDDRFIVRDAYDGVVADCWNGTIGDEGETALDTCEPNANLIAAAPAMLSALKEARTRTVHVPLSHGRRKLEAFLDAIIAKAEGDSNA